MMKKHTKITMTTTEGIPPSIPVPYFRRYEIMKDGTVFNTFTRRVIKPKKDGKSVCLTMDSGTYTTRTVKGLLDITWGRK